MLSGGGDELSVGTVVGGFCFGGEKTTRQLIHITMVGYAGTTVTLSTAWLIGTCTAFKNLLAFTFFH